MTDQSAPAWPGYHGPDPVTLEERATAAADAWARETYGDLPVKGPATARFTEDWDDQGNLLERWEWVEIEDTAGDVIARIDLGHWAVDPAAADDSRRDAAAGGLAMMVIVLVCVVILQAMAT